MGAVGDGTAAEAVALDRPLEALALRVARDLDPLPLLEDVDGQLLANLEALALAAELAQVAQRRVARLLQVAELGLRQLALGHVAVAELHGVVAVALGRPQAGNPARARLHDRDALDGAVLHEQLRHPDLRSEQSRHQTNWIWMSTPAGMFQHYRIRDDPEYAQALALGEDAIGVDLFIGEPELIGHGHGPKMLGAFLRKVAMPFHGLDVCVIGPSVSNVAAIRAYEKTGFVSLRTALVPGEPEPEQLMRITRGDLGPE